MRKHRALGQHAEVGHADQRACRRPRARRAATPEVAIPTRRAGSVGEDLPRQRVEAEDVADGEHHRHVLDPDERADVSPDATVETMTFGKPYGSVLHDLPCSWACPACRRGRSRRATSSRSARLLAAAAWSRPRSSRARQLLPRRVLEQRRERRAARLRDLLARWSRRRVTPGSPTTPMSTSSARPPSASTLLPSGSRTSSSLGVEGGEDRDRGRHLGALHGVSSRSGGRAELLGRRRAPRARSAGARSTTPSRSRGRWCVEHVLAVLRRLERGAVGDEDHVGVDLAHRCVDLLGAARGLLDRLAGVVAALAALGRAGVEAEDVRLGALERSGGCPPCRRRARS